MRNEQKFKRNVLQLLTSTYSSISQFYREILGLDACGFFEIEKKTYSNRLIDLGPSSEFHFSFDHDDRQLKEVIRLLSEIIEERVGSKNLNWLHLLVFCSFFEDHLHDQPLQKLFYKKIRNNTPPLFVREFILQSNKINWKQNLDLNDNPNTIEEWDSLFRSMGHLYLHNNVIEVIVFALQEAKDDSETKMPGLVKLLKARVLFELDLNTYLELFEESDVDFLISYLFSRFTPHFVKEEKSLPVLKESLVSYSQDARKFEELIEYIFMDYYYDSKDTRAICLEIKEIIAAVLYQKIKDQTYNPRLEFQDFILYPRVLSLFDDMKLAVDDLTIFDHIVRTFSSNLKIETIFFDEKVSFGFPYEPLAKQHQEAYSYILYAICNCSEETFKGLISSLRKFSFSLIPYFRGRYRAESYATNATSHIFLILLSVTWLEGDLVRNEIRFKQLIDVVSEILLESYSLNLVNHLKSYSKSSNYPDSINAFFFMMDEARKTNKLDVHALISERVVSLIPLEWPWSK